MSVQLYYGFDDNEDIVMCGDIDRTSQSELLDKAIDKVMPRVDRRELTEALAAQAKQDFEREAAMVQAYPILRAALEGIAAFGKRNPGYGYSCAEIAEEALKGLP